MIDKKEMAEWAKDNLKISHDLDYNGSSITKLEVYDGEEWIEICWDFIPIYID